MNDELIIIINNSCPRGEIGRHKGLKKHRVEIFYSLTQSHTILNPIKSYTLKNLKLFLLENMNNKSTQTRRRLEVRQINLYNLCDEK